MSEEKASQANTDDANTNDSVASQKSEPAEKETSEILYGKPDKSEDDSKSDDDDKSESEDESTDDEKAGNDKDDESEQDEDSKDDSKDESEFNLKMPENTKLSEADRERIAAYAKEQGLSKEAAQKLLKSESEARDQYFNGLQERHKEMVQEWASQAKQDKELGGENFGKNLEFAKRAVQRFGTPALMEKLNETGYGSHPEVVRVFSRIGRAMADDSLVRSGHQSGGERTMEDIFYGKQN